MKSDETANYIKDILDEKKGKDIDVINISGKTIIADWFVICSGTSVTHIRMLADEVMQKMGQRGKRVHRVEGYEAATWILLDFGDVITHIFHETERNFYSLERLWSDSRIRKNNSEGDRYAGN